MSHFLIVTFTVLGFGFSAFAQNQSPNATFQKLAKIVELQACPSDFSQSVSETVKRLCGDAKAGKEVESETYLTEESESAPEIDCKYADKQYEVIFSGTPAYRDSTLTVTVDDKGQILKMTKDQLEVLGKTCQDLASNIDKGSRVPASADTELCFDYYPSTKLAPSRDHMSCK